MSLDSEHEFDEPEWTPRPIVFPTFKIPARLAAPVAWALIAAATLSVIAALVRAVSYRESAQVNSGLIGQGVKVFQPSLGIADRISLFAQSAASLTVALVVVVAVVVAAMAARPDEEEQAPSERLSAVLPATAAIGSIVLLANIAQAIVILNNSTGLFTAPDSANKASSILALFPPTLSAAAVLVYAVSRLRASVGGTEQAGG
jgi:hypothetical protein